MRQTIAIILAVAFFCGGGVLTEEKLSVDERKQLLLKALEVRAESGHAKYQFELGVDYYRGSGKYGLIKDEAKGMEWVRKAANQGHPLAQQIVGQKLHVDGDNVRGYAWCLLAKANGGGSYPKYRLSEVIESLESNLSDEQKLQGQNLARSLQKQIRENLAAKKAKKEAEEKKAKEETQTEENE